jgi:type VI secretion system protein ImpK
VEAFRAQVRQLVASANRDARQLGFTEEDTGYALYAVIAFLDETVLGHANPVFRSWTGKPLQEEVFGINIGGDVFFQYLETLLAREDTASLGEILEVYYLCLLLGFRGRYGGSRQDAIHPWIARVRDRLQRLTGEAPPFAPHWAPSGTPLARRAGDPVQRTLLTVLILLLAATAIGYVFFDRILRGTARAIAAMGGA